MKIDLALFESTRMPPKRDAAGGSRELPGASQLYRQSETNRDALGEIITLGNSREPPAAPYFWTHNASSQIPFSAGLHDKAAPRQAVGFSISSNAFPASPFRYNGVPDYAKTGPSYPNVCSPCAQYLPGTSIMTR